MLGFPVSTEPKHKTPVAKAKIITQFKLTGIKRAWFDETVSSVSITNQVNLQSMPSLRQGGDIKDIIVFHIVVKTKEYGMLSALFAEHIKAKVILVVQYQQSFQCAIFQRMLIFSPWVDESQLPEIPLSGLTLDVIWASAVTAVGGFEVPPEMLIDDFIEYTDSNNKILAEITKLEKKMNAEVQSKRKFELYQQIINLKKKITKL